MPEIPAGAVAVPGFPFYYATKDGEIYSCRTRGGRVCQWSKMTPAVGRKGRLVIGMRRDGILHQKYLHHWILICFVGPMPEGKEGCHNDGNHLNNALENLRWDTHLENMADRTRHGRAPSGERNGSAILTETQVSEIRRLNREGMTQKAIAPLFGVSKQCVQTVCSRTTWRNVA